MTTDMTLSVDETTPGFPDFPTFEREYIQTYEDDGKVSRGFFMNAHLGTHVDAPAHFIDGAATVDELPLDVFHGPARVVDLRERRGDEITAASLAERAPDIGSGERVVLLTGDVDERFGDDDFFDEAAVLTAGAAEWLVDRRVALVANDFLTESIDDPDRPVHQTLLSAGIPIVEYLCNAVSVTTFESVLFDCYPLRLRGFEASPVRAVARSPRE